MGYVIVAVIAVGVAIFAMQNTTRVDVWFTFWQLPQVPVAGVVLVSFVAGLIFAALPLSIRLWLARRRASTLATTLEAARANAQARAAAPLTPAGPVRPPSPPPPGSTPR